jgi:hypothetical protein
VTGKPMDRETAVRRAASKTGLSEVEIRVAHALLGRRQDLRQSFIKYDSSRCGEMSREDVMHMLEALDVPCNKDLIDLLMQKYDVDKNGLLDYPEFEKWMGPLMELSDGNLRRLGLEKMPADELAELRRMMGVTGADAPAASGAPPPLPPTHRGSTAGSVAAGGAAAAVRARVSIGGARPSSAAAAGPGRAGATIRFDDGRSVATATMDLDPIAAKMRRVLGKSWMNVAKDIQAEAQREAQRSSGVLGSVAANAGSGVVPASVMRDALATKGVALTSKEVRALSLKYHGSGVPATRTVDGAVDVSRVMADVFGPPRPGTGTMRRPQSAAVGALRH